MRAVRGSALVMGVVLAGAVGLGGCAQDDAPGADDDKVKVGLVQINQQAIFFNQMNEGAQEAATKAGADLTIFNANDDAAKQNEAIANFVTQGFDAVIVVAIDTEGIKPAVREASEAGVKVIAVDAIVDDPAVSVQVGVDNAAAGNQIGAFTNDLIAKERINPKIGVVGALNSFIQNIRKDSFAKTVQGGGATITQTVDGQNRQESALTAAENLLTSQADSPIVYATGEPALLGAIAAVRSQNRQKVVKLVGWDLTKEAIQGIDAGFVAGVVQQDPRTEGVEAVNAAVALSTGKAVDKRIDVPVTIVTRDNVDKFRAIFK